MAPVDPSSFHLRLPAQLLKRIKVAAAENDRSMTLEIVARLERTFGEDGTDRQQVLRLLRDALAIVDKGAR